MSRLVSITITAVVSDDTDLGAFGIQLFDVSEQPMQEWAEVNGWEATLLDADITMNVEADED